MQILQKNVPVKIEYKHLKNNNTWTVPKFRYFQIAIYLTLTTLNSLLLLSMTQIDIVRYKCTIYFLLFSQT